MFTTHHVALQCEGPLQCDLLSLIAQPVSGLRQDANFSLLPLYDQSVHRSCLGNKLNLVSSRLIQHFSKSAHDPSYTSLSIQLFPHQVNCALCGAYISRLRNQSKSEHTVWNTINMVAFPHSLCPPSPFPPLLSLPRTLTHCRASIL